MYIAPSQPIEIEKFSKGQIKPTGQELEFLQKSPENNRKLEVYYGKAQEQLARPENKQKANMNQDQIQRFPEQQHQFQFPEGRWQDNRLKVNQKHGSIMNPQSYICTQRFDSVPYNTIFTDNNIYKAVPENTTQINVQPLEHRISAQSLRGPQRGYVQGLRGLSQDYQQPEIGFYPQDFRQMDKQGFGLVHQDYRRMAPPGILNEFRRGIPEPIFHKRNNWMEERRDYKDRVYPIRDYEQVPRGVVSYVRQSVILKEKNIFPQEYGRFPCFDSEGQRYERQSDFGMYNQHRVPGYYVRDNEGNIGMQRERERMDRYGNSINQQEWVFPSFYGQKGQQIKREGMEDQNAERDCWGFGRRRYGQEQRIKQG